MQKILMCSCWHARRLKCKQWATGWVKLKTTCESSTLSTSIIRTFRSGKCTSLFLWKGASVPNSAKSSAITSNKVSSACSIVATRVVFLTHSASETAFLTSLDFTWSMAKIMLTFVMRRWLSCSVISNFSPRSTKSWIVTARQTLPMLWAIWTTDLTQRSQN